MRLLLLFILISVTAYGQKSPLTGIWQSSQPGYQSTMILNNDGTGEFDGEPIKYSTRGNALTIVTDSNETLTYTYSLTGSTLKVSGGDLEAPVTFSRAATGSDE